MSKRVLIVIHNLKIGGGAQRIAAEVGTNLNERGHEVSFLTIYDERPMYDFEGELIVLNEERDEFPLEFSWNALRTAKKINEVCEREGIETVISFLPQANFSAVLSKMLFRSGARIVVSVRNNPLKMGKKEREQVKWLYPRADKVVAQTERVEKILNDELSIENTTKIPNLVDIKEFKRSGSENVKSGHEEIFEGGFVFITVGSLTEQKGHWYLLRCFKKITQKFEKCRLVILGDGKLRSRLEELADKMEIEDKVFFLGTLDNVFPYLRNSDCFVLTSLYEGFPNVILEALSQDLPVISTDCVAGPREILCPELEVEEDIEYPYFGEYGILTERMDGERIFDPLDEKTLDEKEKKLAETMNKIKKDEKLLKKYSVGTERVKDFSAEKIIDKWEDLI